MKDIVLTPFDQVLAAYGAGKMVIIVDDHNRENEGDLCVATEWITVSHISFMSKYGRGLICVSISSEVGDAISIPYQVEQNNSAYQTPFTVTVDHISVAKNGSLPLSKAITMKSLLYKEAKPTDFISPGSVFPLRAHPAGVLGRNGQTEGSYDLARLSGCKPSGVICEILSEDGTMLRGTQLADFAKKFNLPVTSVAEIIKARLQGEVLVREVTRNYVNTQFGTFLGIVFKDDATSKEHLAMIYGDVSSQAQCLVRIHSECLTGDVFGSLRCDCGDQLALSSKKITEHGSGIILYLRQEGRGIGLTNKLKAYALQDTGLDTVEANLELGFAADERDFHVAAQILHALKINDIDLLTNNPEKQEVLESCGIKISRRTPVIIPANRYSFGYLDSKKTKMGHLL